MKYCELVLTALVLSWVSSAYATAAGARPDARHPWAVHDEHRPLPQHVDTPADRAPSDAVVLFDGTDGSRLRNWCAKGGKPADWVVDRGELVSGNNINIETRESFGACQLHIEWRVPGGDESHGNSGVLMMGRYEIQILDSHGAVSNDDPLKREDYADGMCGAVYGQCPPAVNATRPAEVWQSYDIVFHPPRHEDGREVEPATATVFQNGVLIVDHFRMEGPTTWGARVSPRHDGVEEGPLVLQYHGAPVRFRNIWIRRIAGRSGMSAAAVSALRAELAEKTKAMARTAEGPYRRMLLLYESYAYRPDKAILNEARASEAAVAAALDAMDGAACYRNWHLVDDLAWWLKMMLKAGLVEDNTPLAKAIRRADALWRERYGK